MFPGFSSIQLGVNKSGLVSERLVQNTPLSVRAQLILARETGISPGNARLNIRAEGQLSTEQEELFCKTLEILAGTSIGRNLFSEINAKLAVRNPPQDKLHIILSPSKLSFGCHVCVNDTNFQLEVNLDFEQSGTYPFLGRKENGNFGFFQVQYPLSIVLGHELGHVLQYLESVDAMTSMTFSTFYAATQRRFNGMTPALIAAFQADCNLVLRTVGLPEIHFNPEAGLITAFMELESRNFPENIKAQLRDYKDVIGFIAAAWNEQFADLPNILLESGQDGQIAYSDGGLLSQVLRATCEEPADSPQRPNFFKISQDHAGAGGALFPETLRSIREPGASLVRWGHSSIGCWSDAGNLTAAEQARWQRYAIALLGALPIDLAHLPILRAGGSAFF